MLLNVSAYVCSMILDHHDSEDSIQNTVAGFAERIDSLDPSRELVPWILTTARYEVVNHFCAKG